MNKKELENEIMKTQEQLKKLQAALDEAEKLEKEVPEKLIFKEKDEYCYVDSMGDICWNRYTHMSSGDIKRVHNRRAFLQEKLAEIFAEKTQFIADLLHFKYLYDRDYEPDWDSVDEQKFYVYYNNETKKFEWNFAIAYSQFGSVYFSTAQLAEKCADWLNKKHD